MDSAMRRATIRTTRLGVADHRRRQSDCDGAGTLNLVGVLTPEDRVAAVYRNRVLYRDGLPLAALEGAQLKRLAESDLSDEKLRTLLARRSLRHPLRPHLRLPTARESEQAAALRARH